MASWKAGGDGKPVTFNRIPWHEDRHGYCPALHEPCNCVSLGRDFCRQIAANSKNDEDRP